MLDCHRVSPSPRAYDSINMEFTALSMLYLIGLLGLSAGATVGLRGISTGAGATGAINWC